MATFALINAEGVFFYEENNTVILEETASRGAVPLPDDFEDTVEIHVFSTMEAAMAFESGLVIAAEMYGGDMIYIPSIGVYRFAGKVRPAVALRYAPAQGEAPGLILVDDIQEG